MSGCNDRLNMKETKFTTKIITLLVLLVSIVTSASLAYGDAEVDRESASVVNEAQ